MNKTIRISAALCFVALMVWATFFRRPGLEMCERLSVGEYVNLSILLAMIVIVAWNHATLKKIHRDLAKAKSDIDAATACMAASTAASMRNSLVDIRDSLDNQPNK